MRSLVIVALGLGGCACEDSLGGTSDDGGTLDKGIECQPTCGASEVCCGITGECEPDPTAGLAEGCADPRACSNVETLSCDPGYCPGFKSAGDDRWDESSCEISPGPCVCVEAPPLAPGLLGRHSDLAVSQGVAFVASYEEQFGDLVVGTASLADLADISWTVADGLPASTVQPTHAPSSWRGGVSAPGDDVGYFTSLQVGSDGQPRVSYYDLSHGELKFAHLADGSVSSHVIDSTDGARVGLYSSLALAADNVPIVAYMAYGVRESNRVYAEARVARARVAEPASAEDWSVDVVEDIAIPCAGLCDGAEVCLAGSWQCASEVDGCVGECLPGYVCVDGGGGPSCGETLSDPTVTDLPNGVGLWSSLALHPDGRPAVVYYSRLPESGALHGASFDGQMWEAPRVIDAGADRDVGQSASLVIDSSSAFHVSYVDAAADDLIYLAWNGTPITREVVDNGDRGEGDVHVVGADSSLVLDVDGQPIIVYQDQTMSDLLLASREGSGSWEIVIVAGGEPGYGFYADLAQAEGDETGLFASTFYYEPTADPPGGLALFALP